MEEATCQGVSVNTTVCFSVAQALAAARGDRARPPTARGRGTRRRSDGPGRHDHDGPDRGLAPASRRSATGSSPTRSALPWSGVAVFKRAYGLFRRARLPGAPPRGGDPAPLPLVGADRRRRRHHDAVELAEAVQRVRRRGPAADGRPGRSGDRRRAHCAFPRLRPRPRAGRPDAATSSTPSRRRPGRSGRSSPRTTSCCTRSPTRWFRTRTSSTGLRSVADRRSTARPRRTTCPSTSCTSGPTPTARVAVDPTRAGWRYLSFRTAWLDPSVAIAGGRTRCRDVRRPDRRAPTRSSNAAARRLASRGSVRSVRRTAVGLVPATGYGGADCRSRVRPREADAGRDRDGAVIRPRRRRDRSRSDSARRTSRPRSAAPETRRARSTTSSPPTSRPTASRSSRS